MYPVAVPGAYRATTRDGGRNAGSRPSLTEVNLAGEVLVALAAVPAIIPAIAPTLWLRRVRSRSWLLSRERG
jgi:hypothetical protein